MYKLETLSIPAEEYHTESRNGHYLSSHLLTDFRKSPELYCKASSVVLTKEDTAK